MAIVVYHGWMVSLRTLAICSLTALAGCSGGGGDGAPTPSPTPTITPTPTPEPTPTPIPFPADRCFLRWTTTAASGNRNSYLVDLPASAWMTGGTVAYADATAVFVYDTVDGSYETAQLIALPDSGSFSVTVAGLQQGDAVTFTDAVAQTLVQYDLSTGMPGTTPVASGGDGGFTGVWSDPFETDPAALDPGTGSIAIVVSGSNLAIGTTHSVGQCYQSSL